MGPTAKTAVAQIHPTRRCNLRCPHCQSSSSPQATDVLRADLLKTALDDLAAEGYTRASFSGGEPLLYAPLPYVLSHARQVGLQTAVVTNGMALNPDRLDAIEEVTDLLMISIDGTPASHNRIRNSPKAFDTMSTKLPELQVRGIRFGFLFTLTPHNLDELPWVAEFALNVGAKLLQIHALGFSDDFAPRLPGGSPCAATGASAWNLAKELQQLFAGQMAVEIDLVHSGAQQPEELSPDECDDRLHGRLGQLLSPLVIEPDGEVLPARYGFHRSYALGNLRQRRIRDMAEGWRGDTGPRFHALCRQVHEAMSDNSSGRIFNWSEQIAAQARRQDPAVAQPVPVAMGNGQDRPRIWG